MNQNIPVRPPAVRRRKRKANRASYYFLAFSVLMLITSLFMLTLRLMAEPKEKQPTDDTDSQIDILPIPDGELDLDGEPETEPVPDNSDLVRLPFELTSSAVFLYDLDADEILYSKNPQTRLSPASLTKIMTAILTLEKVPDIAGTYSTYTAAMTEELLGYGYDLDDLSNYGFLDGERVSIQDALYILMLRSGNDAANFLADYVANGSIPDFVDMMNAKARELGAYDTHFTNAHGLDDRDLYTTAYDMFLITQYAMTLPHFLEIAESSFYTVPENNKNPELTISTVIEMQNEEYARPGLYYPYLRGIKTGYTDDAGRCLISSAEKDGRRLLLVLMGTPLTDRAGNRVASTLYFEETRDMYEWAFD